MFEKGEKVYYGTAGVCKVNDICCSPFDSNDERTFYVLEPSDFNAGTIIYAPADNETVILCALMTVDEANVLIANAGSLPTVGIANEKQRRDEYRNAIRNGTPESIASVLKTIYLRKSKRNTQKKRMSDTDIEFDKLARRALFTELAVVLDISTEEAEKRMDEAMQKISI